MTTRLHKMSGERKSVRFADNGDGKSMNADDARAMFRGQAGGGRRKDTRNLTFSSRFREAGASFDEKRPLLESQNSSSDAADNATPEDKVGFFCYL
jgi:hypothetical protein